MSPIPLPLTSSLLHAPSQTRPYPPWSAPLSTHHSSHHTHPSWHTPPPSPRLPPLDCFTFLFPPHNTQHLASLSSPTLVPPRSRRRTLSCLVSWSVCWYLIDSVYLARGRKEQIEFVEHVRSLRAACGPRRPRNQRTIIQIALFTHLDVKQKISDTSRNGVWRPSS